MTQHAEKNRRKTLFLLVFHRQQIRNFLRNTAYADFAARPDIRIVIFTADHKVRQFSEEFGRDNVVIESIPDIPDPFSLLDKVFHHFSYFYVDTKLVRHNRRRFILAADGAHIRFALSMLGVCIVGNCKPLRSLIKFLDRTLVTKRYFTEHFEKYKPDVVFVPHIASRLDRAFIRTARDLGVPSVGAINSWDTIGFSKYPIRILPDTLLVHNDIIRREAIAHLDARPENIEVFGMPHFDHYVNHPRSSRESFFKRVGLDPNRRLILFAPFLDTAWQTAHILQEAILKGDIPSDVQMLIRQHPTTDMNMGELKLAPGISVIERPVTFFKADDQEYSDITKKDMEHLADTLFHSDVSINLCSTMTIDAAAFDTPIVNVAFDGWEDVPYYQGAPQYYDESRVHYVPIIKSGGVRIAWSKEELIEHVNNYLENPSFDREGRKRIVREQCWNLDGKAGERVFNCLLKYGRELL